MQNREWIDLFRLIPEDQHNTLVLTSKTGVNLGIDIILRTEPSYLVFRGRALGQTEDGRVFFLPYQQIDFLQFNRQVKEVEIKALYGESPEGEETRPAANVFASEANGIILPTGGSANGLPASPASPSAPVPVALPTRGSLPGIAARLSSVTGPNRPSVVPGMPARPANGTPLPAAGGEADDALAPPRNSILERLRAQRNSVLPQKPAGR